MAQIFIETTPEEHESVIKVLRELNGEPTSVAKIASIAGMKDSRVRYTIQDLLQACKIERVPTKCYNKFYVRYGYKVL